MSHVVTAPPAPFLACDGRLTVQALPAAEDNLVWLLTCNSTGAVGVVDGPSAAEVLAASPRLDVVLNTHTHGDHVGINHDLVRRGLLSATGDRPAGERPAVTVYGPRAVAADVPGLTHPVDDGDTVRVGDVEGRVLRTDGHLFGHVSFVFGDVLFCGDTLFTGGCGYLFGRTPERPHGDADAMFRSLLRLAALPGDTRVCCAHEYTRDGLLFARMVEPDNAALLARWDAMEATLGAGGTCVPSTIELERATNAFLRPGSPTIRARVVERLADADVSTPLATFASLRRLKDTKRHRVP